MKLNVKSPKDKHEVEISETANVLELRTAVAEKFGTSIDKVCLIFGGKILKDEETLAQHAIKDGLTVHLVVRSGAKTEPTPTQSAASSSASQPSFTAPSASNTGQTGAAAANPLGNMFGMGLGGAGGFGYPDLSGGGMAEMQQRMMANLMNNPDQLRSIMDSPFVRELTSNPDVFRGILQNHPQFRELTERNPELGHLLNNPDVLRQSLELARNPAMLNEMMRNYDRTLANVENLPGGFAALQRMYRDVQDPLMNAAQEAFGAPNPYATSENRRAANPTGAGSTGTAGAQQGAENLAPLPNPWSASRPNAGRSTNNSSGLAAALGGMPFGLGGGTGGGMTGLWQQMATNPDFVNSVMQSPITQSMMQTLINDPAAFESMLNMNPLLTGQPQLADELRTQMRTIMGNPALQRMMTNPRALSALAQIQSGVLALQREDPELANLLGFGFAFPGNPSLLAAAAAAAGGNQSQPTATSTDPQTVPGQAQAQASDAAAAQGTAMDSSRPADQSSSTPQPESTAQNEAFSNMMNQVLQMLINQRASGGQQSGTGANAAQAATTGSAPGAGASMAQLASLLGALGDVSGAGQAGVGAGQAATSPEERYATQLSQLEAMGFYDRQANLQALIATRGNVDAAIDRLLQTQ